MSNIPYRFGAAKETEHRLLYFADNQKQPADQPKELPDAITAAKSQEFIEAVKLAAQEGELQRNALELFIQKAVEDADVDKEELANFEKVYLPHLEKKGFEKKDYEDDKNKFHDILLKALEMDASLRTDTPTAVDPEDFVAKSIELLHKEITELVLQRSILAKDEGKKEELKTIDEEITNNVKELIKLQKNYERRTGDIPKAPPIVDATIKQKQEVQENERLVLIAELEIKAEQVPMTQQQQFVLNTMQKQDASIQHSLSADGTLFIMQMKDGIATNVRSFSAEGKQLISPAALKQYATTQLQKRIETMPDEDKRIIKKYIRRASETISIVSQLDEITDARLAAFIALRFDDLNVLVSALEQKKPREWGILADTGGTDAKGNPFVYRISKQGELERYSPGSGREYMGTLGWVRTDDTNAPVPEYGALIAGLSPKVLDRLRQNAVQGMYLSDTLAQYVPENIARLWREKGVNAQAFKQQRLQFPFPFGGPKNETVAEATIQPTPASGAIAEGITIGTVAEAVNAVKFASPNETLTLNVSEDELTPEITEVLVKSPNALNLPNLKKLPPGTSEKFEERTAATTFGITEISVQDSQNLARAGGDLAFPKLMTLEKSAAKAFQLHQHGLKINVGNILHEGVCDALRYHRGPLEVVGIQQLTEKDAAALHKYKGTELIMHISSMETDAARQLAKPAYLLNIKYVGVLDQDVAKILEPDTNSNVILERSLTTS